MGDQLIMYGMRRGFPQKKLINKAILRMRETGLLQHNKKLSVPECGKFDSVGF